MEQADHHYKKVLLLVVCILMCISIVIYSFMYIKKEKVVMMPQPEKESLHIDRSDVKKVLLDNGMTILIFVTKSAPKVLLQVAYRVGSAVETVGEKGLAHLLEHMIFKGTETLSEGDIDASARKYGATYNAFTSKEVTSYFFEVNKDNWVPFVDIMADCMKNARFDADHLASEMRAVIQELRMYRDNYWSLMLQKASSMMFPANHPYHYPIIGFKEDLALVNAEKLRSFYNKYYHPGQATLFVVGDVDPEAVVAHVQKSFGTIPKGDPIHEPRYPVLHDLQREKATIYQNVQREQLGFFWRIPGRRVVKDSLVEALEFVLGGSEGSRLSKRLVDTDKIASGIYVGCEHLLHEGIFMVLIEPHEGKTDACKKALIDELKNLIKNGVTSEELKRVVINKQRDFLELLECNQSLGYEWIQSYFTTGNEYDLFSKVNELEKLTAQDVQNFAKHHLDPFFMNELSVKPLPEDKKELWSTLQEQEEALEQKLVGMTQRATAVEAPRFVHTLQAPLPVHFVFPKQDCSFTLPNGLHVILHHFPEWPLVSLSCLYRDYDFYADAREGFAIGIMMDMLMEQSEGLTRDQILTFFEDFGVKYQVGRRGLAATMTACNADVVIEKLFHILLKPVFNVDALEKLQAIAVDALTRAKDEPTVVADRLLKNSIYKNTPYEWTFDEAIDFVGELDSDSLTKLHKKTVAPEKMIVSIAGDFDLEKMKAFIAKSSQHWSGSSYKRKELLSSEFTAEVLDQIMLRDQAVIAFGRPSEVTINHQDYIPLQILNMIAFYSLGSRIYQLREQTGLFYSARGKWAANATKKKGYDFIKTMVNKENIERAEQGIRNLVNEIGQKGVTQEEFDDAKQLFIKGIIDLTSSTQSRASVFAQLQALDLPHDYYDTVLQRVQSMSLDEINRCAHIYFNDERMTRVRVGRLN